MSDEGHVDADVILNCRIVISSVQHQTRTVGSV